MLKYLGLHEYGTFVRVKTCGKKVEKKIPCIFFYDRGICVIGSKGMPVCNEVITFISVLKTHPVTERTNKVTNMKVATWLHAT
jgi:hypothetical protein